MSINHRISIITPNYNYANYIGETIQSVIDQNYDNFEHIIVDDGSTDNSVEIIKQYISKYPDKIKLFQQENKGQTAAINVGLKFSTGDIIGWINSDDLYNHNTFNKINNFFINNLSIEAVYSNLIIINSESEIIRYKKYLKFDYSYGCLLGFGNLIANNTLFMKRQVLDKVGILNENLKYVMDSEFYYRLGTHSKIDYIDDYFGLFRQHEQAKSSTSRNNFKIEESSLLKHYYKSHRISHFFSYKLAFIPRLYFRSKRVVIRLIKGHYFK